LNVLTLPKPPPESLPSNPNSYVSRCVETKQPPLISLVPRSTPALANIGKPMPAKDIVMLVVSGLREEFNGVKQTLFARDFTVVFTSCRS
jgi:hypothetical protein